MSSTVITARRFGSVIYPVNGQRYFAWFNSSYESNVTPKIPSECCSYFGRIEDVTRETVDRLRSVAGGMLQRRSGPFSIGGFTRAINAALKQVRKLDPDTIIDVGAAIPETEIDAYAAAMEANWYPDAAKELAETRQLHVRLGDHPDLIAWLTSERNHVGAVPAWRLIKPSAMTDSPAAGERLQTGDPYPYRPDAGLVGDVDGQRVFVLSWPVGTAPGHDRTVQVIGTARDVVYEAMGRLVAPLADKDWAEALSLANLLEPLVEGKVCGIMRLSDRSEVELDMRREVAGWSDEAKARIASFMPGDSEQEPWRYVSTLGAVRDNGCLEVFRTYPYYLHLRITPPN